MSKSTTTGKIEAPKLEEPKKTNSIDLDKVNAVMDNSMVEFKLNGVKLSAPKRYMGDKTAIAGKIKPDGLIRFHRCKPANTDKYSVHETEHGTLSFGENFRSALKVLVK